MTHFYAHFSFVVSLLLIAVLIVSIIVVRSKFVLTAAELNGGFSSTLHVLRKGAP